MSTVQETTVLNKIRSRGYWRVVIRPTEFQSRRVPQYADLFPIVEKNSVQHRGYPHVDRSQQILHGDYWVSQEYDRGDELEVWRIYQSGLFTHFFAIAGDWSDHPRFWPAERGREVNFLSTLHAFVSIFEFASRLALSPAGASHMIVEIDIEGLASRRVTTTDNVIDMFVVHTTDAPKWNHRWEGTQTDLIARPRDLAALAAQDFFARFGYNVSKEFLLKFQ